MQIFIGISGYQYKHWRGAFYPEALPQKRWFEFACRHFGSLELNGTFYSLKNPQVYRRWVEMSPADFIFAIKGSRFITHNLKLKNCRQALANFLASGILELGHKTGPFLWQLPELVKFDAERIFQFLSLLPRTTADAEELAKEHDERLKRGSQVEAAAALPLRHAFEVRHSSFDCPEFFDLLRQFDCSSVWADTAGRFLRTEAVTTDFVYVRLHGSRELYVSRYSDAELDAWAKRVRQWTSEGRKVYVYFDNDGKGHAPYDALRLAARLGDGTGYSAAPPEEFLGRMGS